MVWDRNSYTNILIIILSKYTIFYKHCLTNVHVFYTIEYNRTRFYALYTASLAHLTHTATSPWR